MGNKPREVEMDTANCFCDHCGVLLDKRKRFWVWNEHFGCCKAHVQLAQGSANTSAEEKDADLL